VCTCSLNYPACKVHSPYCTVICVLSGSIVFSHIIQHAKYIRHIVLSFVSCLVLSYFHTLSSMQSTFAILYCHLCPVWFYRIFTHYPACKVHSPYCTVICVLSGSIVFSHFIAQTTQFSGKVVEHKMCVLIFLTIFVRNTSHCTKN